jgi:hypothetical protein
MNNIFNIKISEDRELEKIYEEAMDELNDFFNIRWAVDRPKICIVDDRKTINALKDRETPNWLVGWPTGRVVYVLNKDSFSTESNLNYSENDYKMLIKHELAHSFFKNMTGGKTRPDWLWEGISILASGQAEAWEKPLELRSFLDDKEVYKEAGYALLLISNKYGKDKIIQLLKRYKTYQGEFPELFQEEFGIPLSYDFFNNLIQNQTY